jgi:hypothetical protein
MRSIRKSFNVEKKSTDAPSLIKIFILGLLVPGMLASSISESKPKNFALRRAPPSPGSEEKNARQWEEGNVANVGTRGLLTRIQTFVQGIVTYSGEARSDSHRTMTSSTNDDGTFSYNNVGTVGNGANKSEWPECLSLTCGTCQQLIQYEDPSLSIVDIVSPDTTMLQEFRRDRVLIICTNGQVIRIPRVR